MLAVAFVSGSQLFSRHLNALHTNLALGRLPDIVVAADGALDPDRRDTKHVADTDADVAAVGRIAGVERTEGVTQAAVSFDDKQDISVAQGVAAVIATAWTDFPMTTGNPPWSSPRDAPPLAASSR